MKRELKIRLERFGRTVIGEVLDMDESEIGKGMLIEMPNNKFIKFLYLCLFEVNMSKGQEGMILSMDKNIDYNYYGMPPFSPAGMGMYDMSGTGNFNSDFCQNSNANNLFWFDNQTD